MIVCYFTFPTIYEILRAEKVVSRAGLDFKIVPVPRRLSSSCGTALRCFPENAEAVRRCLENADINVEGFYELETEESGGILAWLSKRWYKR